MGVMRIMCREIWKKENIITFLEIIILIIGVKYCFLNKILYAIICLIFLGICDGFDGKVAGKLREKGASKDYGIQLDSLADILSSGFFPVLICFSMGFTKPIDLIVYGIFLICGITRLSYFNVRTSSDEKFFEGIPITVSTMVLPIIYLLTKSEFVFITTLFILSILYVGNIKIKKLSLIAKIFLSVIGIILAIIIFVKGM